MHAVFYCRSIRDTSWWNLLLLLQLTTEGSPKVMKQCKYQQTPTQSADESQQWEENNYLQIVDFRQSALLSVVHIPDDAQVCLTLLPDIKTPCVRKKLTYHRRILAKAAAYQRECVLSCQIRWQSIWSCLLTYSLLAQSEGERSQIYFYSSVWNCNFTCFASEEKLCCLTVARFCCFYF